MTPLFTPVPVAASNLTDAELVRLVEYSYPNLQGPLRAMFDRFATHAQADTDLSPAPPAGFTCVHCGSAFVLKDDTTDKHEERLL